MVRERNLRLALLMRFSSCFITTSKATVLRHLAESSKQLGDLFTGHTCIGQSRSNPPPNYSQVGIILDCTVQECNRPLARQSTYTPLYFQNQESPCGSAVAIQGAGTTLISTSAICPSGSIVSRRHQRNWCDYGTPS